MTSAVEPKPTFNLAAFLNGAGNDKLVKVKSGGTFFVQGDPADATYYLQKGAAKVVVVSARGREAVISTIGPGDFFGEQSLAGHRKRVASVVALKDSSALKFEKRAIVRLLHDEPDLSEFFIAYLLSRSQRTEEDLVDHLFNSSEKRLARILLLLSNFGKDDPPERILAKVSQETLAQMVGTTRSRVSSFMNKFRKLGFIDYNGELFVHRSLLDVVLSENGEPTEPRLPNKSADPV
jgi:CRP/FNR family cyclic AMP-dependent transcriptional regulator